MPTPTEEVLNSLGEPTFTSLGLGGYAPSGWIQSGLEALHVGLDLPWWGAIVAGKYISFFFSTIDGLIAGYGTA